MARYRSREPIDADDRDPEIPVLCCEDCPGWKTRQEQRAHADIASSGALYWCPLCQHEWCPQGLNVWDLPGRPTVGEFVEIGLRLSLLLSTTLFVIAETMLLLMEHTSLDSVAVPLATFLISMVTVPVSWWILTSILNAAEAIGRTAFRKVWGEPL